MTAGLTVTGMKPQLSGRIGCYFAEEIDVRYHITPAQPPLSQLDQHSVESVAVPIVTQFLITARAIFLLYQFGIAQAAYSIMPPRRVFGDAAENTSHVRMAGMPFGQ